MKKKYTFVAMLIPLLFLVSCDRLQQQDKESEQVITDKSWALIEEALPQLLECEAGKEAVAGNFRILCLSYTNVSFWDTEIEGFVPRAYLSVEIHIDNKTVVMVTYYVDEHGTVLGSTRPQYS